MTHYSRIAERKSTTPTEWLATCAQIGQVANEWADRTDLAVYAGDDSANGEAIAAFYADTAEIEINLPQAFGKLTTPEMVGDLRNRDCQYDWAEPTGVIYHEALHARFSAGWNIDQLNEEIKNEKVRKIFWLLEESRIEGLGVNVIPRNALFLRSSAMGLSFAEAEENISEQTPTEAYAHLAGLTLARVDADVLDEFDVAILERKITNCLGEELVEKLREIWCEFQGLNSMSRTDTSRGIKLAEKWVELVREKALENGESPNDPEQGESGEGMSGALSDLLEALDEARGDVAMSVFDDLAEQQDKEEMTKTVQSRQAESKRQSANKETAKRVFSISSGAGDSGSSSRLTEVRKPDSQERSGAVLVAKMLEKAKYVERSMTEIQSVLPSGKLRTKAIVQKKALEAKGIRTEVPVWRKTQRKRTDDPTLSIGVLVDISGSMSSAMNPMASMAWILSEAGRRVQAKTAMVYFGSGVFPTLKVGQHLSEVKVYTAPDGTEKFGEAYNAIDGELNLVAGSGVRILVVVSDGNFTGMEKESVRKAITECQRNGVVVLWITPKECYYAEAEALLKGTHAEWVKITDTASVAQAIGKSASVALAKMSSVA